MESSYRAKQAKRYTNFQALGRGKVENRSSLMNPLSEKPIIEEFESSIKSEGKENFKKGRVSGGFVSRFRNWEIKGCEKLELSDYEAYLKKIEEIGNSNTSIFLKNLKIAPKTTNSLNIKEIKQDFDYCILNTKQKDLIWISEEIIMDNQFCSDNFQRENICNLVTQISFGYNVLPYHNFTHAVSVFLSIVQINENCNEFSSIFGDFEIFVAQIAALAHDINHKGTNSLYEIKKKSDLAMIYRNESVLENMHISRFYKIGRQYPECDIFGKMKDEKKREEGKKLLNRLILGTDVQGHSKNLVKLQEISKSKKESSKYTREEKYVILENIFHACDIGNPCLDFEHYMNWSALVSEEFHQQALFEKAEKLEVSNNMEYVDIQTHYKRQIGFICKYEIILEFLVMPVWKEISCIFPELESFTKNIEENRKKLYLAICETE